MVAKRRSVTSLPLGYADGSLLSQDPDKIFNGADTAGAGVAMAASVDSIRTALASNQQTASSQRKTRPRRTSVKKKISCEKSFSQNVRERTAKDEENFDGDYDDVLEVFDEWSHEEVRESLQAEPRRARLYRTVSFLAGLTRPLTERDYKKGLKEYKGNLEDFNAYYLLDKVEKTNTGFQLHSEHLPFDAYQLFKEAGSGFMLFMVFLYFVMLSSLFAAFGWGCDCFGDDLTLETFLPTGFLLLSGVGDSVMKEDNSTACLYVNSLAILIGVYVSLPVFGAVVLVRLLDNRAALIKSSDVVLLTRRKGVPVVMIRCCSASGCALSNFSATLDAYTLEHDEDTDDGFICKSTLEIEHSAMLAYYPNYIKHICDENSPLVHRGVVTVDKYGVPQWNLSKLAMLFLSCNADGARWHGKTYLHNPKLFIGPDERGRHPFFVNSVPVNHLHWMKYKGTVSIVNDLSKLSKWKYNEREFRPSGKTSY